MRELIAAVDTRYCAAFCCTWIGKCNLLPWGRTPITECGLTVVQKIEILRRESGRKAMSWANEYIIKLEAIKRP